MYYEVYIDQLFIENLVLLALLQKICGKLRNIHLSWKKIWLSSVFGAAALCAVIFFRPESVWIRTGIAGILPFAFAAAAGQRGRSLKETGGQMFCLLAASALFGGFFQIIFSIWEPPVLLAAALAYTAIDILIEKQKESMVLGECRTEIVLEDQGSRWMLTGLIDTGNHLTEPLTGRPVSILDWQEAAKMQRFCHILEEENGYLYIPYHAIGTEKGWMMGMVIDAMYIKYRKEEIRISHPVLAVSRESLSPGGGYQMIVNPLQIYKR